MAAARVDSSVPFLHGLLGNNQKPDSPQEFLYLSTKLYLQWYPWQSMASTMQSVRPYILDILGSLSLILLQVLFSYLVNGYENILFPSSSDHMQAPKGSDILTFSFLNSIVIFKYHWSEFYWINPWQWSKTRINVKQMNRFHWSSFFSAWELLWYVYYLLSLH